MSERLRVITKDQRIVYKRTEKETRYQADLIKENGGTLAVAYGPTRREACRTALRDYLAVLAERAAEVARLLGNKDLPGACTCRNCRSYKK